MFATSLLDEAEDGVDDVGVDDVLYVVFAPVEGEEAHALDSGVIATVSSGTIDHMRHLIQSQPFYVLTQPRPTCAITSSPMKIQSLIFTGIDTSYKLPLLSFFSIF